jgi:integrase
VTALSDSPGRERANHEVPTRDALRTPLVPVLQCYFCQYLINQRQFSPRTIAAYRDTFKLLLAFIERYRRRKPDDLCVQDLDAARVLTFLDHLEQTRHNSARSRNVRLAAIRSFMRYAAASNPLLLAELDRQVIQRAFLTLHVGLGTFKPITAANLEDHAMHCES